jgi:hypothetical protein
MLLGVIILENKLENNKYEQYFAEDLAAIEEELPKSKEYSKIIDDEISKLTAVQSIGSNKGSQRYLIEHITNAVSLQTQRQSLRKDKVALKKAILDYTNKDTKFEGETADMTELVKEFIDLAKNKKKEDSISIPSIDIDSEIDAMLDGQ